MKGGPAEIEHLLLSHIQKLSRQLLFRIPDEKAGQVPVAFVVRQVGSLIDESQISDCMAEQVASYKRIRRVLFIDALPKNAQGTVPRKELVKLAIPSTICFGGKTVATIFSSQLARTYNYLK